MGLAEQGWKKRRFDRGRLTSVQEFEGSGVQVKALTA